jgi:hypothetical protein
MIGLGILLVIFLAGSVYLSIIQGEKHAVPASKGPVKNPKRSGMSRLWERDSNNRFSQAVAFFRS